LAKHWEEPQVPFYRVFYCSPFSFVVGVKLKPLSFLACLPIMFLIALGLVTIGHSLAARIESLEGFNLIMSFVIMPMFFLSGALFPIYVDTLVLSGITGAIILIAAWEFNLKK
jgi:hypothetical protein